MLRWVIVAGLFLSMMAGFQWRLAPIGLIPSNLAMTQPARDNLPTSTARLPALSPDLEASLSNNTARAYDLASQSARPSHWTATNAAHYLALDFGPDGVSINDWRLRLVGAPAIPPIAQGNRVEYRRGDGLTEWYINGPAGLEQGFTLDRAPQGQTDWLTLPISFEGVQVTASGSDQQWLDLKSQAGANLGRYGQLSGYDARHNRLESHLTPGPDGQSALLRVKLSGASYPVVIDPFVQQNLLTASDGAAGTEFGSAIALSRDGTTLLVGARYANAAYILVRNGPGWTPQAKLTVSPAINQDALLGFSVALSEDGNTALVGAPGEKVGNNQFQGASYVFIRNGTSWTQQNRLAAGDGAANDFFGSWVTLTRDGNTAFAGASNKMVGSNAGQGAVYLYHRSGTSWSEQSQLAANDGAPGDQFGSSIALNNDGSLVLVGAYNKTISDPDRKGAAYIFTCAALSCTQQSRLTAPNGDQTATFGNAVSLSADGATALVGAAVGGPGTEGTAYVFTNSGPSWSQQARLAASDGVGGDNFGFALALSEDGNTALVGAPFKAVGNTASQGQAYAFGRVGSNWSQQEFFSSSDNNAGENFGYVITLSSDAKTTLTGAPSRRVDNNSGQGGVFEFKLLAPSSTSLVSAPNPSAYGQSVTFTATVVPITATGSVTFKFDGATPVTLSLTGSNQAIYVTSTLAVGQHSVTATYNGDTALAPSISPILTQTVTAGPPAAIVAVSGGGQSANISTTFAAPLVVQVTDAGSNPVSGTLVTFTAPSSGPGGTFAGSSLVYSGQTDVSGRITTTAFSANGIVGSYNVTATVGGVVQPALFGLTNLNGCDPLVVTSTADDGTTCGTLRVAIAAASGGSNKQITINLPAGSVISLTTGLTLTSGVALTTTAVVSPGPNATPPVILQGSGPNSGNGLTLTTNNRLYGIWVRGFSGRQIVFPAASHAVLGWVKVSQS